MRTLVVHSDDAFQDAVRFLRQPAVFVVAVQVLHIFRDAIRRG
ncbi:type IV secretion protein Rhs [Salmonella enterica subsp. enterica]|nr:type IV secretion protein Rhs [Salmonella enterica]ECI7593177.1 type IV secretion protein Rhs [Salmonella enterica subsp. enterica]EDC1111311.1 type IV secretion protein Rhs [Salmonella enterica subsp. enterica serovar Senftenberg]EAU0218300.1 type IV secretion protein Rhs [Salmonella enterica]EDC1124846.1 type IV secretion protein Rhs [Salmonella enterica subsp. enterica serovar Senftenberg]